MSKIPKLKIGTRVEIILDKSNVHLRSSVYDLEENSVVITSQTTPPLGSQFIGRWMLVTYLSQIKGRVSRFGFNAQVLGFNSDYQLHNGSVEAIILKQQGQSGLTDFRSYYRIRPPADSNVSLFIEGRRVDLVDVSVGGARFAYSRSRKFTRGEGVKVKLVVDKLEFNTGATVRFTIAIESADIQHIGIEFDHDVKMAAMLSSVIFKIERWLICEGKIE